MKEAGQYECVLFDFICTKSQKYALNHNDNKEMKGFGGPLRLWWKIKRKKALQRILRVMGTLIALIVTGYIIYYIIILYCFKQLLNQAV